MPDSLLVVAIGIGTEFSSYFFSTKSDYRTNPMRIFVNSWKTNNGFRVYKNSTCILFDSEGTFHSFGYEAEKHYSELAQKVQHINWYFFRRFPVQLYKCKCLTRETLLEDVKGKKMEATKVFSSVIRYFKDHLDGYFRSIEVCDITLVLTAPVNLNESLKEFMRGAAEKVGICGDRLMIVPEPETASVYCMYQEMQHDNRVFDSGAKYMIIIAEDETVEMTVYEVQHNEILKELYKAERGDWGGHKVDESFLGLLADIVGNDVMEEFRSDFSDSCFDLMQGFDRKKKATRPDQMGTITFTLPCELFQTFNKINPEGDINTFIKSKPKYKNHITLHGDKLRVEAQIVKALFEESCNKIIYHMQELFRYPNLTNVSFILLVGEYAESHMLQEAIGKAFCDKKLIVPYSAVDAVLKGAVLYGHRHQIKSESDMNS